MSATTELDTQDEEACVLFCQQHEPVLTNVLSLNQCQLEQLIEILADHLSEAMETPEFHGQISNFNWMTKWLYALFVCLRLPLEPEVHSCLRTIAKSCIEVIDHLKSLPNAPSDSFLQWNLIVVIIAISFKQFDLLSL